jgi:hypothetical protein
MYTIWELLQNMSQSTLEGFFGVGGIFIFFIAIVIAASYRIKEQMEEEEH